MLFSGMEGPRTRRREWRSHEKSALGDLASRDAFTPKQRVNEGDEGSAGSL